MVGQHVRRLGLAAAVPLVLAASGCGKKTPDYTPGQQTAIEAVRRGLDAWKDGKEPGEVRGTSPVVHVTDTGRKPGQLLRDYRIHGETRGSAGRTFAVTLQLTNPDEELKTRYIVIGIDPLWVFRQEDFELLMHWDHHMPAPADAGPPDAGTTAADPVPSADAPSRP